MGACTRTHVQAKQGWIRAGKQGGGKAGEAVMGSARDQDIAAGRQGDSTEATQGVTGVRQDSNRCLGQIPSRRNVSLHLTAVAAHVC